MVKIVCFYIFFYGNTDASVRCIGIYWQGNIHYPVNNYTKTGGSLQNWKIFPESKSQSLSTPQISTTPNPQTKTKITIIPNLQKPHTKNQIKINWGKCRKTGEKCRKTTNKIYKNILKSQKNYIVFLTKIKSSIYCWRLF